MTGIVIDASVTLAWCFPDEQTTMSLNVLDRLKTGDQAFAPAFWSVEVLNTLLVGERKGRIAPEQTKAFVDTLRVLNPVLDYATLEQVAGPVQIICRDHRLTPYDALYVELALRSGYPLATLDQPQREAAKALGVHCL
jgi:predicted nucleic acid-binding protein